MIYLTIFNVILFLSTIVILIFIHKKNKIKQNDFIQGFIDNVTKIPLFFINMKVKKDGNLLYFVDSARVVKADQTDFRWVILDYINDKNKHFNIKLPTYAVFLTAEEANAFLIGDLDLNELEFVE